MSGVFPPSIIVAAQAADRKWMVPASVSLAQWALESAWGTRNMGTANNCFGIKPWKTGQPKVMIDTHEVIAGKRVAVKQPFCVFASIAECFDAHGLFLVRNDRYAKAFLAADGIAFAKAVARAGYATDPDYASKLVSLITRYGLMQFDVTARITLPPVASTPVTAAPSLPAPSPLAIAREPAPAAPGFWARLRSIFSRKA